MPRVHHVSTYVKPLYQQNKINTLDHGNRAIVSGVESRQVKEAERLERVAFGERRKAHLSERLSDAHERFELAHSDREAAALARLSLVFLGAVPHLHVARLETLAHLRQTRPACPAHAIAMQVAALRPRYSYVYCASYSYLLTSRTAIASVIPCSILGYSALQVISRHLRTADNRRCNAWEDRAASRCAAPGTAPPARAHLQPEYLRTTCPPSRAGCSPRCCSPSSQRWCAAAPTWRATVYQKSFSNQQLHLSLSLLNRREIKLIELKWCCVNVDTESACASCRAFRIKMKSKRERIVGIRSMFSSVWSESSQRPNNELAAASTAHREFRVVIMPALAIEIVCCSIAILVNSATQLITLMRLSVSYE